MRKYVLLVATDNGEVIVFGNAHGNPFTTATSAGAAMRRIEGSTPSGVRVLVLEINPDPTRITREGK